MPAAQVLLGGSRAKVCETSLDFSRSVMHVVLPGYFDVGASCQ